MTPQQFKAARLAMSMTQKQMAEWLYTNDRRIRAWEKGEAPIPGGVRRALSLSLSYFPASDIKIGDKIHMPDGKIWEVTNFANPKK